MIAAAVALPVALLAYPSGAPAGYTGAPASSVDTGNTCTSCHGGTASTTGMSISGFGAGNTYTPGAVEHLTVMVPASTSPKGFEFTARLASSTGTNEGTLLSTDANTQVLSGGIFITHTSTGNATNTFNFDWTPPSTNVGDIVFYAAGVSGFSNVFKTSLTLTPNAGTTLPTLSANPPGPLNFSFQSGSTTMPPPQTFTVSSSNGSPVSFSASASGGSWLSVSPTTGVTGSTGTLTVSVNPAGQAAGTHNGAITVTSSGASNTLTVNVVLTVTSVTAPSVSASPTSLTFSGHNFSSPQTVSVTSNGASVPFTVNVHTSPGDPSWLSASCSGSCATPENVTVSVNTTGLTPGASYSGSITFTPTDTSIAPVTVTVSAKVPHHLKP